MCSLVLLTRQPPSPTPCIKPHRAASLMLRTENSGVRGESEREEEKLEEEKEQKEIREEGQSALASRGGLGNWIVTEVK